MVRARAALERQQQEDVAALRQGIDDMKAGRAIPMEEAHPKIRDQLVSKYGK